MKKCDSKQGVGWVGVIREGGLIELFLQSFTSSAELFAYV